MSLVRPLPSSARRRLPTSALAAALAVAGVAHAQVGTNYVFTQSTGVYVPITGGTLLGTPTGTTGAAALDDVNYAVTLPFAFQFDGAPYTNIYVNTNGNLTFGATAPATTNYTALSATTAYNGAVAAFGRDLTAGWVFSADRVLGSNQLTNVSANGPMQVGDFLSGTGIPANTTIVAIAGNTITLSANATTTGTLGACAAFGPWAELRTETLGTSPNQVFVVQWQNFKRFGSTLTTAQHMVLNFQIRLHEATGKVEVVYGDCSPGLSTLTTVNQVGLRGPTNAFPANINNRLNTKGVNDDWQNSVPGTANTSGMVFNNVAPANVIANGLTFDWALPSGAYANFTADVTGGASPLAVNFTDQSFTTVPGGITSWAWDFDGDTVTDSTLQNPSFVYTACGTYNVTLTVGDGVSPPSTLTKTAYIRTDAIAGNFTYGLIAPLTVQFTDTSNMPATSWAWDLDGDTITDSTAQNPVWVYPNTNPVNVTLTVARLCSANSTVTKSVVAAQQLTTVLVANNSVGAPATLYYNLDVLNPQGVSISGFDSVSTTLSTPFTVDWYVKEGTYSGFELNAAPWTQVGTASGVSNPVSGAPSNATFPQAIYLPAGSYGIAMRFVGITARYISLTVPTTYGNGDLALTAGSASLSTAGAFTGTNLNTPRAWCGTLYYSTHNIAGQAGYGFFAPGCAGSMGVSHLAGNAPQLGTPLNVTIDNLPLSAAIMLTGFSRTTSAFGPLPLDLTPFGAPGCVGRVSPDATLFVFGAGNTANWGFTVPNDPSLSGLPMYNQAIAVDPGFNALGGVTSDAAALIIGL